MTRWKRWTVVTVLGLIVFAAWVVVTPAGISTRNALRLAEGMNEERVEELLATAGDLTLDSSDLFEKRWNSGDTTITVVFDRKTRCMRSGCLVQQERNWSQHYPLTRLPMGEGLELADRVRLWFGF